MTAPPAPVLVACAHGTRNPTGRRLIAELALAARALRPGLVTTAAFVDVQPPTVVDVVGGLAAEGRPAVVVPLLLSGGYHVHVDIAGAVAAHDSVVAARPLGPDPRLAEVLHARLVEAGADPADPSTAVVLAAAGSSDARSVADVDRTAALLQHSWAGPVTTGYGSAAQPPVPDAVATARERGARRVVVASYLLAPGHFHDKLAGAGADVVTAPLLPDERIAAVLLDRYDAVLGAERPGR
ncbi:sirohydrochlorin chelatase [Blastococcus sp. MG754426]|uniref:sirohydrochlorin chelatase n=1 Tax=unclassified Blastococcus TaxID=2619396 RepID=UPI001EEFB603|nr:MULTISPECIES: CbiX/SirB N-terminal domain-containing protein [unclassified Blastococcus]MCF6508057.1 sirohydrochlorin chelatase [Blastococcus sp. MG754426]MCF6512826.1 sirohydrochlorin chelatase [Blastococcus sp. MG754427]MCF6736237.1 sirohydrochlorin chelatase [Blastococcus sp. KM273129]